MDALKHLEDFRHNEYLATYLMLMSDAANPKVEMTYNEYAMHGFYSLSDDISDLENEKNFVNNGRRTLPSIALWYLSFEAFINSLCKIVSYVFDKDPQLQIKKDIGSRLNYLFTELGYDENEIKKTGLYNRVNEFRQFRNELFHDRNVGDEIPFKKTNFSSIPVFSNQVDTFQAAIITIEVMTLFRYSIKGLDLMPNISIGNSKILHFDKLDTLYLKYLKPYFEKVLLKHKLLTKLSLDISTFKSLPPNKLIFQGEIVVIGRIEQEDKFKYPLDTTTTSIGRDLYTQIVQSYNLPNGHISGLNFIVDWQDFYKSRYPMRR